LLVQTLDNKKHCVGIYSDGRLIYDCEEFDFDAVTATWNYNSVFSENDTVVASLLVYGKTLDEACPDFLNHRWRAINARLRAFYKSFSTSKISLDIHCFYDLVPQRFLLEYCEIKNKITQYVIDTYAKPANYDFMRSLAKFTYEIRQNKLNIDYSEIARDSHQLKVRNFIKKSKYIKPYISYNMYGTKTGRMTTRKGYFPILTLDSDYRSIIKPTNDYFVELDYNAAELRVLLGLSGKEQPTEDLHLWNLKNVFRNVGTRDQAKKRIFSWLYNPHSKDELPSRHYDRDGILRKYWNGQVVVTPVNRVIQADKHHALNYLIQSTTSDIVLSRAFQIAEKLKDKNSFISFTLHDSIVLDFDDSERELVGELLTLFSSTPFGKFQVNLSAGKSYGDMRRIQWTQ
jgi:hypothetical protein